MDTCLVITDFDYPPYHPILCNVQGKYLAEHYKIRWFLWGTEKHINSTQFPFVSETILVPRRQGDGQFYDLWNRIKYNIVLLRYIIQNRNEISFVIIRNLLLSAFISIILFKIFNEQQKVFFHLSFPIGDIKNRKYLLNKNNRYILYGYGVIFNIFLKMILSHVSKRFFISRSMLEEYSERFSLPHRNYILPLGAEIIKTNDPISNPLLQQVIQTQSRILVYIGSMDNIRNISFIIDYFKGLLSIDNDLKLVLIGTGNDVKNIERKIKLDGLSNNIVITGFIPHSEIQSILPLCSIGISLIPPYPEFVISSPTKIFEYFAAGIPVVANSEIPEQEFFINKYNCGVSGKYSLEPLINKTSEILLNKDEFLKKKNNAQNVIINERSFDKIYEQFFSDINIIE